jgi:signal transduction histidine kinase/DNA-binding response OmpR family regulator/ligand-binding sensor domain-containing protein
MRICGAVLLPFVPTLLLAQTFDYNSQPLLVSAPGIISRLERFAPLSISENPELNSMPISRLAVDHNGFLWCATSKGLARFDGYDLKNYRVDLADTTGIFKLEVQAIAVDGDGFVWGGTTNAGIVKLDPITGRSCWYRGREDDSTSIGNGAYRLFVSADGALWAGTRFGLAKYNPASDSFLRYNLPPDCPRLHTSPSPTDYPITSICELGRSLWVGLRGGGLGELNRDTGVWKWYTHTPSSGAGPSSDVIRAVCPDRQGRLWIATRDTGLDCYDPRSGVWRHFSVSLRGILPYKNDTMPERCPPIWSMAQDSLGGLWLTSMRAGVFRLDQATGKYTLFHHDSTDANSLPHNNQNWLGSQYVSQEDRLGRAQSGTTVLWIPCGAEGMYRIIVRKDPCTSVTVRPNTGTGFVIRALSPESPGKVWALGIPLGSFNLQDSTVKWHPQSLVDFFRVGGISQLTRLHDGTFLVSSADFKAWTYETQHDTFIPFVPDLHVTSSLEESDSLLWLGCRNTLGMSYLAALNRQTGKCTVYPRQDPDSASHRDETVTTMCTDRRGSLWYGTQGGGLIRFDMNQKTYRRYAGIPGSKNALIANSVNALIPDSARRLWVGTVAGLALMDCDKGTFEHIHNNLEENLEPLIKGMVDDAEGHLWIAAHQGAFCFTKATRAFRTLTPPSRIHASFIWSVMFEPIPRMVTFGGANGFFSFPIDDPPPVSVPPPVFLTSFKVFDKDHPLESDISYLKSITLSHSASFFSFTFAALDFIDAAKNRYAYRLEGVDPQWIQAGTRRYVSYTNLDPGRYTFRVRAANSEGIWNEQGTALEIIILPPWYRTTWAYGAYFLGFGGILYLLRTFDRRRAAMKHSLEMKSFEAAKMRELDQMKSAFFANISHEFRTPLTLILGPLDQFGERFKNDEHAQATLSTIRRNGLRLLQLVNQLLDLSKMDAGKMSVQIRPIEVVGLSRSLVMSFLSLADRKKISFIFDPEEDEIIAYTDRDKYEKILTNLLSNAFKFTGEGGEIKVILRALDGNAESGVIPPAGAINRFELVVADTGIGIDPAHIGKVFDRFYQIAASHDQERGGTGIGLALAKELVEVLKGTITAKSLPGHGSTFTVQLPLRKEAWRSEDIVTDERIADFDGAETNAAAFVEAQHTEAAPLEPNSGKPVVLIVEDNTDVRAYVRGFLAKEYTIEEAENGKVALEKARAKGIDLVISDVMMPVMDGVQFCRELKADDRINHIPVILLTARASMEGKLEGLDIGADDYVVKPFDARELMARVKNLIISRKTLREKYHQQVTFGPTDIPVASADERFLKRLSEQLEQHIADPAYDTESLAHDLCMSRMQLNRKLHALTGHSTHGVVRDFRLQRAEQLLRAGAKNISGVAYDVGFSSLSHFAHAFREKFGVNPSEYGKHESTAGSQ